MKLLDEVVYRIRNAIGDYATYHGDPIWYRSESQAIATRNRMNAVSQPKTWKVYKYHLVEEEIED